MSSAVNQNDAEFNPFNTNEYFSDAVTGDAWEKKMTSVEMRKKKTHYKIMKIFLMVSVNLYDLIGLLDMLPCGTLHSTKPYISYKMKY